MKTARKTIKLAEAWNGHQKGAVIDLTEPQAETLCRNGLAEPVGWKFSKPGTKSVASSKVATKG